MTTVVDQRVLQGSAAVLRVTILDADGEPDDSVSGVTVGIVDAAGTEVVAAGTAATDAGTDEPGDWTYTLTRAQTASLAVLTATWKNAGGDTLATTRHEVAGMFYFSHAELVAVHRTLAGKFPATRVREVREEIETLAEDFCGVSFVPRYARERFDGTGTPRLILDPRRPRTISAVWVYEDATNYTAFTAAELADLRLHSWGIVRQDGSVFTAGRQNILVTYEHGYDRPPEDLRRELMTLARVRLNAATSGVPDRSLSWTTPEGETHRMAVPGLSSFVTGVPSVDETLNRYSEKVAAA